MLKIALAAKQKRDFSSWIIWGVSALFVLYQFLIQSSISVMEPSLKNTFQLDAFHFGLVSSVYFYTYLLLQVPVGTLIDKIGVRKVLLISIVLFIIATIAFAKSQSLISLELSRMLMGIAASPAIAATLYLGAQWFPIERFALIAGLTEAVCMLGGSLGQDFFSFSIESIGWRNTMFVSAFIGVVLGIFIWIFVFDKPEKISDHEEDKKYYDEGDLFINIRKVLTDRQVWLNGLISGLLFSVIVAFASTWSVVFLITRYGVSLQMAGFANSMIFLGAAVGAPFFGWISGRYEKQKLCMLIGLITVLTLLLVVIYLSTVTLGMMFFLLLLLGFFSGTYIIPFALVSRRVPYNTHGTAMGFVNFMCVIVGAPILQPFIGYLLEVSKKTSLSYFTSTHYSLLSYQEAFAVLPLCAFTGIILVMFIKEIHYCCLTKP